MAWAVCRRISVAELINMVTWEWSGFGWSSGCTFSLYSGFPHCSLALTEADMMTATTWETFHISFAFSAQMVLPEEHVTSGAWWDNVKIQTQQNWIKFNQFYNIFRTLRNARTFSPLQSTSAIFFFFFCVSFCSFMLYLLISVLFFSVIKLSQ